MLSSRHLLFALALGAMTVAVPASPVFAQDSSEYPPACEASKVTPADVDRAHTVFLSGKQYLEESNYDKAISYFRDAYSIDCNRHAMLPIIATAYERKGDKAEAVRALEEYVRRAPGAADHDVIERRIRNLKDQLARDQPPPAAPSATVSAAPVPPPAPPTVEATAPTGPPLTSAAPPSPGGEGHTAMPWVLVGMGGAAAIAGVVSMVVGAGDVSNADSVCPDRSHCGSQTAVDDGNRGRSLLNLGGILIGGGLAVGGAGLLWHFLEKPAGHAASAKAKAPRVEAFAVPGYAGVSLRGGF